MIKHFLRSALSVTLGVVAPLAAVKTDYSHSTDFGRYQTYSWITVKAGYSLKQDRITQAVGSQFSAKGWSKAPSGGQPQARRRTVLQSQNDRGVSRRSAAAGAFPPALSAK
jgi:hypothetical protein